LALASVVFPASRKSSLLNDSDERGTSAQTMLPSRWKFYNPDQVSNIYPHFAGSTSRIMFLEGCFAWDIHAQELQAAYFKHAGYFWMLVLAS
jgi:hypothetical protein